MDFSDISLYNGTKFKNYVNYSGPKRNFCTENMDTHLAAGSFLSQIQQAHELADARQLAADIFYNF